VSAMSEFYAFIAVVALLACAVGLFRIARAIDHLTKTIVEVVTGFLGNIRAKAISVRPITDDEDEEDGFPPDL